MDTFSEDRVRDWLSLYAERPLEGPSVTDALEDFDYYLSDEYQQGGEGLIDPYAAVDVFESAESAARDHFAYWVMQGAEIRAPYLDLAQRLRHLRMQAVLVSFEANPDHLTPRLSGYGEALLELVATGRSDLVTVTEEVALRVLRSGRYKQPAGSSGYFSAPAKLGVFALEMLAALRGETIAWETFHVPPDRFWLDCARVGLTEPDPDKAAQWARELCDAHMQTLQTDLENGALGAGPGQEIEQAAHFLWPITTVTYLRLRRQLGLSTAEVDHPLMRTSFAILRDWSVPNGDLSIAPWYPDILARVRASAPDLAGALDVIR